MEAMREATSGGAEQQQVQRPSRKRPPPKPPPPPADTPPVSQEAPALIRGLVQDPTVPPRADPAAQNEEAEGESVPYPEEEVAEVKAAEEEVTQVKAEEEKVAEDELPTVPYVADSPADSGEEVEELGTDDWPSWYEGMGEEEEALSSSSSSSTRERPPKRARLAA